MSTLHLLPKIKLQKSVRRGRGTGSGHGAKSTHGEKRRRHGKKIPIFFEGGQNKLTKKLPLLRGKGKNRSYQDKPILISLDQLDAMPVKKEVTIASLIASGIVDIRALKVGVKVLQNGTLSKALIVKVPSSKGAVVAIETAGGKVEV